MVVLGQDQRGGSCRVGMEVKPRTCSGQSAEIIACNNSNSLQGRFLVAQSYLFVVGVVQVYSVLARARSSQ